MCESFAQKSLSAFFLPKIPAFNRIGPHKKEICSLLTGSMLGDGYAEKHGSGVRFHLHYSHNNMEYIMFLHKTFSDNGYCSPEKPKIKKIIGKKGKIYFSLRFRTFTFASFLPFYNDWYSTTRQKQVPVNLSNFLTPFALAAWIMDDGSFTGAGIKIATDCFKKEEVEFLVSVLDSTHGIQANLHKYKSDWRIFIPKSNMPKLVSLIQPYVVPSMQYKLGNFLKSILELGPLYL